MAGRSPAEAVEAFFDAHQRIVACVTPAVLLGRTHHTAKSPHLLTIAGEDGVRLGRRGTFSLSAAIWYDIVPGRKADLWAVDAVGYEYRLRAGGGTDILTYHWHPVGRSPVGYPHLHVGGRTSPVDLSKAHSPTGYVSLSAVVRLVICLVISDLGVAPLRPDWRDVLETAERELDA